MIPDIINELGENREDYFNAASPPIFSTSNFLFDKVKDMREAMVTSNEKPFYTRGHNPTTRVLEKKISNCSKQWYGSCSYCNVITIKKW